MSAGFVKYCEILNFRGVLVRVWTRVLFARQDWVLGTQLFGVRYPGLVLGISRGCKSLVYYALDSTLYIDGYIPCRYVTQKRTRCIHHESVRKQHV
jgi:hypothetical protein